jgi:hypothetical protein
MLCEAVDWKVVESGSLTKQHHVESMAKEDYVALYLEPFLLSTVNREHQIEFPLE